MVRNDGLSEAAIGILKDSVRTIVEFFPIDLEYTRDSEFINTTHDNRLNLKKSLRSNIGIYAFYNSEFEIIYLGKTINNLWDEMKSAYRRPMKHYGRFSVEHPSSEYRKTANGLVRKIIRRQTYIHDTASYFSAYAIDNRGLIDVIELMMIRLMPNDLLNVKMEGNGTLLSYSED